MVGVRTAGGWQGPDNLPQNARGRHRPPAVRYPPEGFKHFLRYHMNAKQEKEYKKSPDTLIKAILSLQKKLKENEEQFHDEPLMVWVRMNDGRDVPRANPFTQEYRAMVRDFAAALKAYKDIIGEQEEAEVNSLDNIRSRFRVAK